MRSVSADSASSVKCEPRHGMENIVVSDGVSHFRCGLRPSSTVFRRSFGDSFFSWIFYLTSTKFCSFPRWPEIPETVFIIILSHFRATVCKTVAPICYRTVVLSVCLSVTLVYCGQTVRWIKMKLGMDVGPGPGHAVLDGDPTPPKKEAQPPIFGPCPLWPNGWMD